MVWGLFREGETKKYWRNGSIQPMAWLSLGSTGNPLDPTEKSPLLRSGLKSRTRAQDILQRFSSILLTDGCFWQANIPGRVTDNTEWQETWSLINGAKINMLIRRMSFTYWTTCDVYLCGKSVLYKPTGLICSWRSAKARERNINFLTTVYFKVHWYCSLNDESKLQVLIVFLFNGKNSMLLMD